MRSALLGLVANFATGLRLALFLPVERQRFRIDAAQLLLAVVVSALSDGAADWLREGPMPVLDWTAAGAELAALGLLVAIAALGAWTFRDPALLTALPVIVLMSLPLVQMANVAPALLAAREDVPSWQPAATFYLMLAWFVAILVRAAFVAGQPGSTRIARGLAAGALLALPLWLPPGVMPEASWWKEASLGPALDPSNPAAEPVLALQRELQDDALGALEDHVQGEIDLYFIAFAPDGAATGEHSRMEQARKAMDQHWDTEGRSLVYANDIATLTEAPIATVTHLREALEEVAAASNPDEDVTMLYLAGRSNADGSLTVSLPPLGLVQLSGPGFAHLLKEAGIKWRVIVLAMCNPQPFVAALADADTVIMAASQDACESGRVPAEVGEAVFGDALQGAPSLLAALQRAQRRLAEHGPAPLLEVGEAIAPQLARLRGGRRGRAASPSAGAG